ncbi:MAG: hypothetical protein WCS37_03505 [Chloroflexota bacterium]
MFDHFRLLFEIPFRLVKIFGFPIHAEPTRELSSSGQPDHQWNGQSKRSIFIRHVDGGSCNAAELEISAIFNPIYDVGRYGFHLVVSPRHADLLLLTGPLTANMETAVLETFRAMPEPRRVVTVGDGFDEDGPFQGSYAIRPLPAEILAFRVAHISGDPPSPAEMVDALLKIFPARNRPKL